MFVAVTGAYFAFPKAYEAIIAWAAQKPSVLLAPRTKTATPRQIGLDAIYATAVRAFITCDLQLFAQPAGSNLDPFDHTYVGLIKDINGAPLLETYYEAGPVSKTTGQLIGSSSNAWLNGLDGPSHTSHSYSTSSGLVWQTGFSSAECPVNAAVAADNTNYPQNKITYSLPSPDSNSFTYSLLTMSGVSIPWWVNQYLGNPLLGPVPGVQLAPGWGTVIHW